MSDLYELLDGDWLDKYLEQINLLDSNHGTNQVSNSRQLWRPWEQTLQESTRAANPNPRLVEYSDSDEDMPALEPINSIGPENPPDISVDFIDNESYALRFCPHCVIRFSRPGDLDVHLSQIHPEYFATGDQFGRGYVGPQIYFSQVQQAINGMFVVYKANLRGAEFKDIDRLFESSVESATQVLQEELNRRRNLRVIFSVLAVFSRTNPATGEIEYTDNTRMPCFRSFDHVILNSSMISKIWTSAMNKIGIEITDFTEFGSGWVLDHIEEFAIKISTFSAIQGSSYIDLPPLLKHKSKTLLNIKNDEFGDDEDEDMCFVWSTLASPSLAGIPEGPFHYKIRARKAKKVSTYKPHIGMLNLEGLTFPMTISQIPRFEEMNPQIAISVIAFELEPRDFETENSDDEDIRQGNLASLKAKANASYNRRQEKIRKKCYPIYMCPELRPVKIDLLLMVADVVEGEQRPDHFVFIRDLPSLLQTHHNRETREICRLCLQTFREKRTLEEHQKYCPALKLQRTTFPLRYKNDICKFTRWERTQALPFVIYADFECILTPVGGDHNSKTVRQQMHQPCAYSWIAINHEGDRHSSNYYHARTENESIHKQFLMEIIQTCETLREEMELFKKAAKVTMTVPEGRALDDSDVCCFCNEPFASSGEQAPVRHHQHTPPYNYIGLSCNNHNLNAKTSDFIPVFFHNFGAYDSQLVLQACDSTIVDSIQIIARNTEKFIMIQINGYIRFLDSYSFFSQSLANLADNLPKNDVKSFCIVRQEFAESSGDIDLLLQKQIYPYNYMTSIERFKETELPGPDAFYDDLNSKEIDSKDYDHLQKVWNSFGLKNLGDLCDLYVRLDSALLACVFEANRRTMMKSYSLDLAHYFSLPMIAKDAVLKISKVRLQLLCDPDQYLLFERGIRGGLVTVGSLRSAKANNPFMQEEYDPKQKTSYIVFLDAVNLYAWAMCEALPEKDFQWVDGKELDNIRRDPEAFIMNLEPNGSVGYTFDVDLYVPEEYHDYLNCYPPAPVKREICRKDLSPFQQELMDRIGTSQEAFRTERLVADLLPKIHYVCHFRLLQMWLSLGCKLGTIHKVIKFTQSKWMKTYIEFNTKMRKQAMTDIEIAFWKAVNVCTFGKFIERLRERVNIIPILDETKGKRYNRKATVQDFRIINENLVLFVMKRLAVNLNNPIAVGFACLEISKLLMYDFHYNYIKKMYGNTAKLVYSDTDSLIYHIEFDNPVGNVYDDFRANAMYFDMSSFNKDHPVWGQYHNPENHKVLGTFGHELPNSIITHVIAPKPKVYMVRHIKDGVDKLSGITIRKVCEKKKAKGIAKRTVEKSIQQVHYENALAGIQNEDVTMKSIRSFNHTLYTVKQRKTSITGDEIKRFCVDSLNTLAHGHKDISKFK